ncbi:MAG: DUF2126 domain-containing protein [Betaproteobacteria bacterium]
MTIRVALSHRTSYCYDRLVSLGPQQVRLKPAAHTRTPIESYSLRISPARHFVNWQQDAYGNFVARLVFPEKTREFTVTVDLVADMTVINPFDFFLEPVAERVPFAYTEVQRRELAPFLDTGEDTPARAAVVAQQRAALPAEGRPAVDFLVALNQAVHARTRYIVRMEPGVQTPEETLVKASGSCRDSGWLLVQVLRRLGLAARFVSGYLIQLAPDVKPLEGPPGPATDFTDLHAWAEVYLPGAGWVGLDATSGLLAGEGHIPLAATAVPGSAAPIEGALDPCETTFDFHMEVTRIHEDPRVTRPFTEAQWARIDRLGEQVDTQLRAWDVRLTMGGEPTFVATDNMDGPEWNFDALGEQKRALAGRLLGRLQARFALGGLAVHGQGKWYPGEPLPRWALGLLWRSDGKPLWIHPALLAGDRPGEAGLAEARGFAAALAGLLGVGSDALIEAYEDPWDAAAAEQRLPVEADLLAAAAGDAVSRGRLARLAEGAVAAPAGLVLPLEAAPRTEAAGHTQWRTSPWPLRRPRLFLLPGDSPLGLRLPLASLPQLLPDEDEPLIPPDPFAPRAPLPPARQQSGEGAAGAAVPPRRVVKTALCIQAREGRVCVFLPPLPTVEDFVTLVSRIEEAASRCSQPVRLEGYLPPPDPRITRLFVTPDPGVIEVNVHPAGSWKQLTATLQTLYEEARAIGLGTEKFMLDGRHTGTGGGNHVTVGGPTPADSPLLRRPDLLRSLIGYWQVHPSLSFLFSGMFIGPTSQAPRVDEARDDNLYELEIAFQEMARQQKSGEETLKPWLVDRLLRHLLVDLTGNTHRAEFSIDKLYSPDGPAGRLGLLEFRAFEMPPHWRMSALQMLLLRALIARFWKTPFTGRLVPWGTALHDRFMLPHFVAADMDEVIDDLNRVAYGFEAQWFAPFFEFRFPRYGTVVCQGMELELRQALEPWHVLGEEAAGSGTTRYVDSSVERLQVKVRHLNPQRFAVLCNGRPVPLAPTGTRGEGVGGVRYRAWQPPSALHPTIAVHTPLVFDLYDTWSGRAVGGCTYHVMHPGGRNYQRFPVNASEAEARRVARFQATGHTPGPMEHRSERPNPAFALTLDLRRAPEHGVGVGRSELGEAGGQQ